MEEQTNDPKRVAERQAPDDEFFGNLKDFIEMMKCWGLGTAFVAAGISVSASSLNFYASLAAAMISLTGGLFVVIASVLLYSRNRMAEKGQSLVDQLNRMAKFTILMIAGLLACAVTAAVIKDKIVHGSTHMESRAS
ncbi:hypothetical protein [Xanthomonas arboricola]|uniref:hypothetical protein n=1 Tax=Xanthomonas arboricola TaxID=56448 RepID=UPI000C8408DF|nr:hypothetical protein [Xanthomonas arboricola]PPU28687.1 hypothetical protein XarCFBP6762_05410 [Xanthomonas arboricola]SOT99590.1 hypothetical protein CFBP6762_02239 [Xanthomonas arboricola pv. fragariae]